MLTRIVRAQLAAFVVIALLGVTYVAVHYVGITQWLGSGYTVHADFTQAGGIFTNAEVTYRGVPVGRVGDVSLTATGIQVDLNISSGDRIPRDVQAIVADRSVIGEQYVDLRPKKTGGPYLHDGSRIGAPDTALPPPVQDVLLNSDELAKSVPIGSLQTVISELYDATQGIGASLQTLISSNKSFFTTADASLPQTIDLITTSKTVLKTQLDEASTIKDFAANLKLIGQQLKTSDGDISKVLSTAAPAVNQIAGLLDEIHGSFHDLLTNLLTTSDVFLASKDGVRQVLVDLPVDVGIGGLVITPAGINVGLVPTFFDPLPCTSGYQGTHVRSGLSTSGNPALNTSASCTAPASSGVDVRGSQNAPKSGG
jgi:phospholipid/cholesterol/gamma-HCH transport system substrate-binding protein